MVAGRDVNKVLVVEFLLKNAPLQKCTTAVENTFAVEISNQTTRSYENHRMNTLK